MVGSLDRRVQKQMKDANKKIAPPDDELEEKLAIPIFEAMNTQKSIFDSNDNGGAMNTQQSIFDRKAIFKTGGDTS